jgi:NAD(P)-dependent dehydrogenase (short-subunit alcohol dehydrogenase family)
LHEKRPSETNNSIEEKETKAFLLKLNALDPSALIAFFEGTELTSDGVDIAHNRADTICSEPVWPDLPLERINLVVPVNLLGAMYGTGITLNAIHLWGEMSLPALHHLHHHLIVETPKGKARPPQINLHKDPFEF